MLSIYIDTTFVFINKGNKPLSNIFKAIFQAILTFITKIKKEPNNQTILDKIQKVANAYFF